MFFYINIYFRYCNDVALVESENVVTLYNKKDLTFSLTLTGNVKGMNGKIKVIAKNNGGEATSEAEMIISGSAPTFVERPIKCTVLEGLFCIKCNGFIKELIIEV